MAYVQSLGNSLFSFFGTTAIFCILMSSWLQGDKLDLSQVYALFACIFVLYITVNALTYLGTVAMSNFSAVLQRFSDLYELKEKAHSEVDRSKPIGIKLENASFGWKTGDKATISNVNLEVRPG